MYEELLKLARETIKAEFDSKSVDVILDIKKKFNKSQACFVTLTKNNELRGCIGSLYPHQELWKDVVDNSINSAFSDPRFPPLDKSEINEIKIEISVLSIPKKLNHKTPEDLLKKIDPKMGLILKKGFFSSTFLPQVWDELPDKIEFLEHLSRKARLSKDSWKDSEFFFYTVDKVKEK